VIEGAIIVFIELLGVAVGVVALRDARVLNLYEGWKVASAGPNLALLKNNVAVSEDVAYPGQIGKRAGGIRR
jgi:hypothetical protein